MALTPGIALQHLDKAAAAWNGPRADHEVLTESLRTVAQAIERLSAVEAELSKARAELEALRGDPPPPEDKE